MKRLKVKLKSKKEKISSEFRQLLDVEFNPEKPKKNNTDIDNDKSMTDGGFVLNGELSSHPWCPIVLIPIYNLKNYWQPAFKWEDFQAQGHNTPRFVKLICIFFINFTSNSQQLKTNFLTLIAIVPVLKFSYFFPLKLLVATFLKERKILLLLFQMFVILFF